MIKAVFRHRKFIVLTVGVLALLYYIGIKTPAIRDPAGKFLDEQSAKLAQKISPENADEIHDFLIHPRDWVGMSWEAFMQATWNPWVRVQDNSGVGYEELKSSKDPADQKMFSEVQKLVEEWYQRVLDRHPEMTITYKNVPPEKNGFLKLLDLIDRLEEPGGLVLPDEIRDCFSGERWNSEAAETFLTTNRALVDEIRAIGLLAEQSVQGVEAHRLGVSGFTNVRHFADILEMDARLAAERGDETAAMESLRAVGGIANHFDQIETPSMLQSTYAILFRMTSQKTFFSQILPSLPVGKCDVAAWEKAINPSPQPPAYLAKTLKGEYHIGLRSLMLPMFLMPGSSMIPPDADAFIDAYTSFFHKNSEAHQSTDLKDFALTSSFIPMDTVGLSWKSRGLGRALLTGFDAWVQGYERAPHHAAMGQAAFAILKGQPVPNDPVYGLPYRWDPATRELSAPSSAAFDLMTLEPITLPK